MLADTDALADQRLTNFALTAVAVTSAVFLIGPRTSPALLLALALAPLAWVGLGELRDRLERIPLPFVLAYAFGLYLLLSVAWAVDRFEAISKVTLYLAMVTAVWVACSAAAMTSERVLAKMLGGVLIAVFIGLAYLCLEQLTDHAIKRLVFTLVPATRLPSRHIVVDDGIVETVRAYTTNRNMAALSLALWPALLIAGSYLAGPRARIAALALFAIAALTVGLSQHDTSVVALIVSVVVFASAWRWPKLTLGLVAAGWVAATLLVVPAVTVAYRDAELHFAAWLPHTARQRVILWGYTADRVAERPWLGVGIASTKPLDNQRAKIAEKPPGYVYPLRTGPHAHDVYLQTWYELGVIGAILLSVLGLAVLRAIARVPTTLLPYALASFATASIVAAFSWGMWQAWFMGGFCVSSVLTVTGLEFAARRSGERLGGG